MASPPPPEAAAQLATPPTESVSPSSARASRLRRAWRIARPFLVLAGELVGYAAILSLVGQLMIYVTLLRDGGAFAREVAQRALADLKTEALPLAVMLVTVEYLTITIHELGHALAARLMGYRFGWLRVEGFVLRRTPRGLRLGVSDGALLGGQAHCLPSSGSAMRLRHVVFTLGGVLMSLSFALVAWLACRRWYRDVPDPRAQPLGTALWIFTFLSLFGVSNFIPIGGRRGYTDGLLIVRTLRGDPSVTRNLALSGLRGCVERHERPRAWPSALIARALALADTPPPDGMPFAYAYDWAMDRGERIRAGEYLDRLLAHSASPDGIEPPLALEAAFYLARYRPDAEGARVWLARGKESPLGALLRPRAEAALALLEGHPTEALALAEAGLAEATRLARDPNAPNVEMEADDLRELVDLARAQLTFPSA